MLSAKFKSDSLPVCHLMPYCGCWLIFSQWSPRWRKYTSLPNACKYVKYVKMAIYNSNAESTAGIQQSKNIYYLIWNAIKFHKLPDQFTVNTVESLLKVVLEASGICALFQDILKGKDLFVALASMSENCSLWRRHSTSDFRWFTITVQKRLCLVSTAEWFHPAVAIT